MKGKAMMKPSVKHALPGLALLLAGLTAMPAQASVTGMAVADDIVSQN